MPSIVDYAIVLQTLESEGLVCQYFNGGSFGFPEDAVARIRGWLGPPDETIRPEMRPRTRMVKEPFEANLAEWAARAWLSILPGNVWVMPASHWSFELTHGNRQWLRDLLKAAGIEPGLIIGRTNASAIEFLPEEQLAFRVLIEGLLKGLTASDFTLVFPGRATVCTLHHHKQLWWVSTDQQTVSKLDGIV